MGWQYWTESAGTGTWREVPEPHADITAGELRVRTGATAVSRGTETLVHTGHVPASIAHLMRAPKQLGDFPFPVSYGYLGVGVVDEGPTDWLGARVFGLLPHHTHHVVTTEDVQRIPDDVPDHRALLAGAAETGLNILWQVPPRIADRVAIIGAGMIGTATALLASGMALDRLEVLETNPQRRRLLTSLGLTAVDPSDAAPDNDIVIHTSGTEQGLARALEITGDDGTVVEASWFGSRAPAVPLGADFHARRLAIVASQVGQVAEGQRARRTRAERLRTALRALRDDRFDALLTGASARQELPEVMNRITADTDLARTTLCHVLTY
ncbi:zinc-binding alcohol dehydrogenase [Kocuria sp.]|uniref:zinc-dependent alcohol dehydrogenase n=1 Tax=Kocuria sp. TaxID=1871328 RepID=UPI0026DF73B4|nr:zinc-binding alcohol dehydrogenase [Kocuria sp.]MDO5367116.1 zinc-binding alcohol dehydrogenase [Kocuria sp.]